MSISSLLGGLIILLIYQHAAKLLQKTSFLVLPWLGSYVGSMDVNPLHFSVQTHRELESIMKIVAL